MISLTKHRLKLIFFQLLFLAFVPAVSAPTTMTDSVQSGITVDQLGQLFIFGFQGQTFNSNLQSKIVKYRPGGFLFFRHNMSSSHQVRILTSQIRRFYKKNGWIQPLLLVDQEGGTVTRLPSRYPLPSAATLGQLADESLTYQYGVLTGQWLKWHGFDMNLAPVLDVASPNQSTFIGSRSYGWMPSQVTSQGIAFARGLLNEQVLPTAKHFPGLGGITQDPHRTQIIHSMSVQDFTTTQIPIYKRFFELQPSAIMMSHLVYKNLDPSMMPATFSQNLIQQLEKKFNYQGLIISDDLLMEAAKIDSEFYKIPIKALLAGIDMQMLTWSNASQKIAFDSLSMQAKKYPSLAHLIQKKSAKIAGIKKMLLTNSAPTISASPDKTQMEKQFQLFEKKWLHAWMRTHLKKFISFKNQPKPLLVISTTHFYSVFRNQLGQQARFINVANLSSEISLTQRKALQHDYKILALVYGQKSAKYISDFFEGSHLENFLILNLAQPGLVSEKLQSNTLSLYSNPPSLADQLGAYFSGKENLNHFSAWNGQVQ